MYFIIHLDDADCSVGCSQVVCMHMASCQVMHCVFVLIYFIYTNTFWWQVLFYWQ